MAGPGSGHSASVSSDLSIIFALWPRITSELSLPLHYTSFTHALHTGT